MHGRARGARTRAGFAVTIRRAPPAASARALALMLAASCARSCLLAGHDIGVCTASAEVQTVAPFCAPLLRYPSTCAPAPAFAGGAGGGAANVSAAAANKDAWLANAYADLVAQRQAIEAGTLAPDDPSQVSYVAAGATVMRRFSAAGGSGADCAAAYKAYACWLAFPRCDGSRRSLHLCRSVCENYFKVRGKGRRQHAWWWW